MPGNEVYEVFQNRNGFLWFTTDNGVVRYDGYDLVRFGVEDGLTDPVVFGIHARRGAGLFNVESRVGSVSGRLRFDSSPYGVSFTIDIPLNKQHSVSQ